MKLIQNTFIKISAFISFIFIIWGVFFYFTIFHEVIDETDDILKNKKMLIIKQVINNPELLKDHDGALLSFSIEELPENEKISFKDKLYNSTRYVEIENENEPVRVLETSFRMNDNKNYKHTLMLSTLEQEDLTETIVGYTLVLYFLFLIVTFIGTRIILKKSFSPVIRLLEWMGSIIPGKKIPQLINPTNIYEYKELNNAALDMALRSENAFNSQKQFIENASHELQTPLAIVMGKLEMMIDDDNLNEIQVNHIQEIFETLNRTVRLNKSLLLLLKIENNQIGETSDVSFSSLAHKITEDLSEIYSYKSINLSFTGDQEFVYKCNMDLALILVSNIIKNAFIHTPMDGFITINISSEKFIVSNTSNNSTPLSPDKIFTRFNNDRYSSNSNSFGLGLSISKSIASAFGLSLEYSFYDNIHSFIISK